MHAIRFVILIGALQPQPTGAIAGRVTFGGAGATVTRSAGVTATRLFHKPITQPHDSFDLLARRAKLGAQPADMDVDRSRFDEPVVAPHALEQAIAREHAVAVLDEETEQLELAARQPDRHAVDGDRRRRRSRR